MTRARRFFVRHKQIAAFVLVGLAAALGIGLVQANGAQDRHRDRVQSYHSCQDGNGVREALREVIQQSFTSGGTGLDLTQLPGYDQLDDATRQWVDGLNALLASRGDPAQVQARIDALLDKVPLRDCDALFPDVAGA